MCGGFDRRRCGAGSGGVAGSRGRGTCGRPGLTAGHPRQATTQCRTAPGGRGRGTRRLRRRSGGGGRRCGRSRSRNGRGRHGRDRVLPCGNDQSLSRCHRSGRRLGRRLEGHRTRGRETCGRPRIATRDPRQTPPQHRLRRSRRLGRGGLREATGLHPGIRYRRRGRRPTHWPAICCGHGTGCGHSSGCRRRLGHGAGNGDHPTPRPRLTPRRARQAGPHLRSTVRRHAYCRRVSSALMSCGTTVNRSPTTPKSATSKIGASGSLSIATIVLDVCIPARC